MTFGVVCLITSCTQAQPADASCNLAPKDLPNLLRSIKPLIERGYSDPEIQALQRLADATPVKQTGVKTFPVSYEGKDATLRVEVKKDDVDELEIWFITQKELAAEIQKKMRELIR
jgi:hypothetical protein